MKAKSPLSLLLLSLSLVLLAPTLTQAFWEKLIKTATLDTKVLAQLETFTSDATGSLEELNKSVHAMVKERRASICCYDVVKQEDKLSLSLRSAIYTAIVALSRLHDTTSEYRQQLNQKCGRCDVPPSEVLCNAEDYPCPSEPEKCITPFQQCDGTPDCIDASDEKFENCFKFPCDRDVMCEENQLCIPASYRCDGRYDCPHGSDETTCNIPFTDTPPTTTMVPTEPSITTFTSTSITNELPLQQCDDFQVRCESDSICIPAIWRCDGDMDCKDGSDEASCDTFSPCRDDQFKCVSGDNCLPAEWRCDGEKDCVDGSDEASCATTTATITTPTPTTTCRYDQFKCVSNGNCVPAIWRCDGEEDCMDGSDEASCTTSTTTTATPTPTTTCDDNQLRCESDGTCLPAIWRCDGDEDCDDGSDEASCTTSTTTTTTPPTTCSDDQFKCVSNDNCVPATWRCNGEEDCMDGSDEASCTTITTTTTTPATAQCDDNQLRCESDGTCLPATWRCDGDKDCNDGSDEASCDSHSPDCKETQFKCASGKCVPELWHCDGEEDCDDGSDEADCLESTTTATTKTEAPDTVRGEACEGSPCSHRCVSVPWANQGFLCTCPEGMELRVPDRHNCVPTGAKGFKGDISGTKGVKG